MPFCVLVVNAAANILTVAGFTTTKPSRFLKAAESVQNAFKWKYIVLSTPIGVIKFVNIITEIRSK